MENNKKWNVLSNHGLVLICLENYNDYPMRLIARVVGITERAVQRIISDLEHSGYIEREKIGRKNKYKILKDRPLRHSIIGHCTIRDYLNCFNADFRESNQQSVLNDWRIGEHGSEMKFQIKES